MAKNLIIVESPAKSKTIKKFLGKNYEVVASNGHVRDMPKSQMGVDFENDFEPKYITIRGKGELLASLRKEVKKADKIYLATDPDREGEAISWHLCHALKLDPKKTSRITFNEITKNAVRQSLKQSREIDMDLVDAQQARRVLDRLVGYSISPLLWQLSAVGTIVSAGYGFVCGAYMPISNFSSGLQKALSYLPGTYGTSLVKNHMLNGVYKEMADTGLPSEAVTVIRNTLDCNPVFRGHVVGVPQMYLIMAGSIVVFGAAYLLIIMIRER